MVETLIEQVRTCIEPILKNRNIFLIDIHVRIGHKKKTVQIFVDTDTGITVEECAQLSREISHVLDSANVIESTYDLEVSSPGLDRSLQNIRQYPRNIGRTFRVKYRSGEELVSFNGVLEAVEGTTVVYKLKNNERLAIEFENIVESIVQLPW
ncbi:MAG: ribosome maturation factor RimP [Bacteroidetes bacterium]|nr:ribosome maturation factor RimP [Bacteroidota bacterium]